MALMRQSGMDGVDEVDGANGGNELDDGSAGWLRQYARRPFSVALAFQEAILSFVLLLLVPYLSWFLPCFFTGGRPQVSEDSVDVRGGR